MCIIVEPAQPGGFGEDSEKEVVQMCQEKNTKGCEHTEKLQGKPEEYTPEQIKECHGEGIEHLANIEEKLVNIEKLLQGQREHNKYYPLFGLGVAFILLGLAFWPLATNAAPSWYQWNCPLLIGIGFAVLFFVSLSLRSARKSRQQD